MRKSRLSGDGRKTRRSTVKKKIKKKASPKPVSEASSYAGDVHRFIGLSLGGGKTDKACLAVMEYYPKHKKVFLSRLVERIKSDEENSADHKIHEIIAEYKNEIESVAFDVPFHTPYCINCTATCPGIESCPEEHVKWMWEYTRKQNKKKKPKKLFTSYTQRCVELYLSTELEEPFQLQDAMGANTAPLLARAMYIKRRLHVPCIEVFPKLSVWRVGRSLNVMKSHLRFHKHAVGGDESRREILNALSTNNVVFVYEQDVKLMIENNHAFEAFICGLTAFLKFKDMTQERPEGFPKREDWVEFPKAVIRWNEF
ncbi:MAG: DUF429 domain-containing protein [Bdellovibrio sp.]